MSVGNLLLDSDLNTKLGDFQGKLLDSQGTVLLDGGATESVTSSMPWPDGNHCDCSTGIFALGTTIYFIITGQPPFPDPDTVDDEDEIQRRFEAGEVPSLEDHQGGDVVRESWTGTYRCADELVVDLLVLQLARNGSSGGQSGVSLQKIPNRDPQAVASERLLRREASRVMQNRAAGLPDGLVRTETAETVSHGPLGAETF